MSWQTDWGAAFGVFSRLVQYQRGTGPNIDIAAFSRRPKTDEVAGSFTATTMIVVMRASDMISRGIYPPKEFDRITLGDSIVRTVSAFEIDYVQASPQWCRMVVSG